LAAGRATAAPGRPQYLYEASSAIGAPQDRTRISNDANLISSRGDVIQVRVDSLIHLHERLAVIVRSRDQPVRANHPDIVSTVVHRADARVGTRSFERLQLGPTLLSQCPARKRQHHHA